MRWQFYPSLGLSYVKNYDKDYKQYGLWVKYLIIGPLQFRWSGVDKKDWKNI